MSIFFTFVAIGVITYLLRAAVVLGQGWIVDETWIEQRIMYVAPAVMAALVASAVFTSAGEIQINNPAEIVAVVVGMAAARRFGNPAAALAAGLPAYWILSALVPV